MRSCSCLILFRVSFYFAAREFRQFESLFFPYRVYFYKVIIYLLIGRFLFTKPLGLNPNLIELNELKTRVSFFLKLDNGKYCP